MRAFHIAAEGEAPRLTELDAPEPGPGEVLVDVKACGLNFGDLLMVSGTYQDTPPAPFTMGMEWAGIVTVCGDGVEGIAPGQRVAAMGGSGGLAQQAKVEASRCLPLPDAMGFKDAAAFAEHARRNRLAADLDRARRWRVEQAHDVKQRRLAGAAWPHDGDELAFSDVEIDVPEDERSLESVAVGLGNVSELDHGLRSRG